ncbi:patatin-like phospholipase family protein [Marinobacter sp. AN1]|uniref:patatin-like phospholipase family protein n=1 Tax=Marinobacter sp. AN1 TaxID=2886046 RepID=UPI00223198FF|nr:patatin-like phospholipase family protein [Marinobacter sp. AN1]UZD64629.1 patatin-like phospholipase family protein [Marinobacter sp. AN1]
MLQSTKLGLVLSGGGAKGAYQAGVLRYLAEQDIQPDAVSGASIGSLNGSVVAGSRNVHEAAETLERVWHEVAESSPLKMDALARISHEGIKESG